ncbi:hypothetical protein [Schinkia azotoformans]|uniref:hypothetical protein n=1 Tax=Schinkia azotoformans TaxID=1454 RepID=UPI002DBE424F|nr:hypothetical protein [Schinkia azotoformans]MEC1759849.1 hypothetical protein [Schinkia azotoformans]
MSEKIKLMLVKPTVYIGDLSVKINASNLGIKMANTSISPIRFNLMSDEIMRKFQELKQKVFNDIAETAVTIEWQEGIDLHVEDDMTFGFPKRRDVLNDVRLNDYLYFMSEEMVEDFTKRFSSYEEEFDKLIEEILYSYDDMINNSFLKILSDFPSVKFIEKDLRNLLAKKEGFENSSEISCGFIDIWLNESDSIIKRCLREVFMTADTIVGRIIRYRYRNDNNDSGKIVELIEKGTQRIEKYNVTSDRNAEGIIDDLKKLHSIYKNTNKASVFDEDKLLDDISDKSDNILR